jgi:hypothetical protein
MGRSSGLVTAAVCSAILVGMFANLPSAEAKSTCQAKLVDNSYDCNFKDNDFPPFTECWTFVTGGVSQYFDLFNGFDDYGCGCNATGGFNSPSYNESSSAFECSDHSAPFLLIGKIKGKKLSVQGVGSTGEQYIGTCTLRSSPCL